MSIEPLDSKGWSACQNNGQIPALDDVNHFYVTHTVDLLSITENIPFLTLFYPQKKAQTAKRLTKRRTQPN